MGVFQKSKRAEGRSAMIKPVHCLFWCFAILLFLTAARPVLCNESKPLWITLAPPKPSTIADGVICEIHGPPADEATRTSNVGNYGRPADRAAGSSRYGRGAGKPPRFESEHRPLPRRSYWLNLGRLTPGLTVSALQPDGSPRSVEVQPLAEGLQLTVDTPMGEGPAHGANNIYAVDRRVVDGVLEVRTAKWLTIHHNCGWGHDHKFDELRQTSQAGTDIPLEIVIDDLWDTNFHSKVMSGDELHIHVLSEGRGVGGAEITVTSDKGWSKTLTSKEDGSASLQLIRDYYPRNWLSFDRDSKSAFTVEAAYEKVERGVYQNSFYDKARLSTTFAWRYYPSAREYQSYAWGLGIALVFSLGSGTGVYAYRERRKRPAREIVFDE